MEDIKISGMGDMSGGTYRSVTVSGMGKCTGAMNAERVAVSGTFKSEGPMECGELTVNGTLKCVGPLSAESFRCGGMGDILGDTVANSLTVGGTLHVKAERLEGEEITCTGILQVDGQISADSLRATGIVKAREIVGDAVSIGSRRFSVLRMFLPASNLSTADLIEATTVELEGVSARVVNGRDVTIGPGCSIDHLDCSGSLHIDPSARVGEVTGDYTAGR